MQDDHDPPGGTVNQMLDLCVFAPVGFVLEARTRVPELINKSRGQVVTARTIGQFAVNRGNATAGDLVADATKRTVLTLSRIGLLPPDVLGSGADVQTPATPAGAGDDSTPSTTSAPASEAAATGSRDATSARVAGEDAGPRDVVEAVEVVEIDPATLAITDYDSLSASQVVPRLNSLSVAELEAVGQYEKANRGRKTILNRIMQLQMD